jgi:uncharacterized protein
VNIYVDSSAFVKTLFVESESPALNRYFAEYPGDNHVTAAISRTELVRAASRRGPLVDTARHALARLNFIAITTGILDTAATLPPPELRTLDAIHLAAALVVPDLRAVVTYDRRLSDAATHAGLPVVSPT